MICLIQNPHNFKNIILWYPFIIFRHPFLADGFYIFSKGTFGANMYTYFEGEVFAKKNDFLVKVFQKVPETLSLACFFKSSFAAQKI